MFPVFILFFLAGKFKYLDLAKKIVKVCLHSAVLPSIWRFFFFILLHFDFWVIFKTLCGLVFIGFPTVKLLRYWPKVEPGKISFWLSLFTTKAIWHEDKYVWTYVFSMISCETARCMLLCSDLKSTRFQWNSACQVGFWSPHLSLSLSTT